MSPPWCEIPVHTKRCRGFQRVMHTCGRFAVRVARLMHKVGGLFFIERFSSSLFWQWGNMRSLANDFEFHVADVGLKSFVGKDSLRTRAPTLLTSVGWLLLCCSSMVRNHWVPKGALVKRGSSRAGCNPWQSSGSIQPAPVACPMVSSATDRAARRNELRQTLKEKEAGFLRRRAIGSLTLQRYSKALHALRLRSKRRLELLSAAELDELVESAINATFFKGGTISEATYMLYGACWWLGVPSKALAKSKAAHAGFRKVEPSPARQPVTWEEVLVAGSVLLDRQEPGSKLLAFALLLGFDLYARPSELLRLRAGHFTSPRRHDRTQRWVVTFFPSTELAMSKTLQQDDSVVLAATQPDRLWLCKPLAHLAVFEKACRSLSGKLPLSFVPHSLRHGGASGDAAAGVATKVIQLRGRWKAHSSVLRYQKPARYIRRRALLSAEFVERAKRAELRVFLVLPPPPLLRLLFSSFASLPLPGSGW
eukprot:6480265-Amphidinium_carterae.1